MLDAKAETGVIDKLLAKRARESEDERVRLTADLVGQLGFQGLRDAVEKLDVLRLDVTERATRIRIPKPTLGMSSAELEGLFNQAAAVIADRLNRDPAAYSEQNSLIGFAHEMMELFKWSRPDVETAMSRVRSNGLLSDYKIDGGLMQLVSVGDNSYA
jgi:hypothetical protein